MLSPKRWAQVKGVLKALRPWVSPDSYRPLILLFVVVMGVVLAPLAVDVGDALLYALPRWVRLLAGQATLVFLMGLGLFRLWQVKPADAWPAPESVPQQHAAMPSAAWMPWALGLPAASLAFPIMVNPDGLGFADWDFVLDKFEALRRTVLVWRQFPWWNPWSRGGFPLAAEPQIGAVSIATPLILTLGTGVGLRIAAILCLIIAVQGAYRLGILWLREPWSAAAVALTYGLNGGVIINTAQGYVLAMSYGVVPWLAYHAFRIDRGDSDALWLGFWLAFAVMNGIQYLTFYGSLLAGLIWLRTLRLQGRSERVRLAGRTVAAAAMFLALCGWRLAVVLPVLLDDKRERVTFWNESIFSIFRHLITRPDPDWSTALPGRFHARYIDLACYVGPIVLILAFLSLKKGWRWWHTLTVIAVWLAVGSVQSYHPSAWLRSWPVFSSLHVVTRWRYLAVLGIGLAAGSVLARWRGSGNRRMRLAASLAVIAIAADFVWLGFQQFPLAFSVRPAPELFPGPPVPTIVNVREGLGYPCAMRGYGVIEGYEPMLSYYRNALTLRRARDDKDYRGEAWTARGIVQPVFWSPNHIVFHVEPGEEVHVNQNPGSWWWANGTPAFPGRRCAELTVPFAVKADHRGRLDLQIRPPGLWFGIGLHVIGAAVLGALGLARLRAEQWR
jgi:hypothetical protein